MSLSELAAADLPQTTPEHSGQVGYSGVFRRLCQSCSATDLDCAGSTCNKWSSEDHELGIIGCGQPGLLKCACWAVQKGFGTNGSQEVNAKTPKP